MDKKLAGLLGAAAGVATVASAHAAIQSQTSVLPLPMAASYSELLAPIGNATALLAGDNAVRAQQGDSRIRLAQDHHHMKVIVKHHHHHHHHKKIIIKKSHHHHHDHHSMYISGASKDV